MKGLKCDNSTGYATNWSWVLRCVTCDTKQLWDGRSVTKRLPRAFTSVTSCTLTHKWIYANIVALSVIRIIILLQQLNIQLTSYIGKVRVSLDTVSVVDWEHSDTIVHGAILGSIRIRVIILLWISSWNQPRQFRVDVSAPLSHVQQHCIANPQELLWDFTPDSHCRCWLAQSARECFYGFPTDGLWWDVAERE